MAIKMVTEELIVLSKDCDKNGKHILGMNIWKVKDGKKGICPVIYPELLEEGEATAEQILNMIIRAFKEIPFKAEDVSKMLYNKTP